MQSVTETPHRNQSDTAALTPSQAHTFDVLLNIGGERPIAPPSLTATLQERIEAGTQSALARWSESSLWLNKSQLFSVLGCETQFRHDRSVERTPGKHPATVVGDLTHRAIQLSYTHPGHPVAEYVRQALSSLRRADEEYEAFFAEADMGTVSDISVNSISRVTAFMDAWPSVRDDWAPRFEEPIQAKVGKLTLSARVDLLLGRPRPNGMQTMFIADWKSGSLNDRHESEAMFYALVATLRHGVPPFRSCVYSLASGTYTEPDVTPARLLAAADQVIAGVNALVDVLTDRRPPTLTPGPSCSYCPLRRECAPGIEWLSTPR